LLGHRALEIVERGKLFALNVRGPLAAAIMPQSLFSLLFIQYVLKLSVIEALFLDEVSYVEKREG
jgi:hypothetical protein